MNPSELLMQLEEQSSMADQAQANQEREQLATLALMECHRLGLPDDLLRHLCMECGIKFDAIGGGKWCVEYENEDHAWVRHGKYNMLDDAKNIAKLLIDGGSTSAIRIYEDY